MNTIQQILSSLIIQSFGWTIIHSLWIGGFIFILSWLLLYSVKNNKANTRYLISLSSLFIFFIAVIFAFTYIYKNQSTQYELNLSVNENLKVISTNLLDVTKISTFTEKFSFASIKNYINKNIPLLVLIWLLGLLFFFFRFMGNLAYTYLIRSKSTNCNNHDWDQWVNKIKKQAGIKKPISIKENSWISTPMLIGFFKPVILMPLGISNGLTLQQVEAILYHEIAHIYRSDYLINLLQTFIEVVFFYHPLVWWLSSNIRCERENSCDDFAIKHTTNVLDYAKALTKLQSINQQSSQIIMTFSNKKNHFMNRIRRIVDLPQMKNSFIEGIVSSVLFMTSIIILTTYSNVVFAKQKQASDSEKPESITKEIIIAENQNESKISAKKIDKNKLTSLNEALKINNNDIHNLSEKLTVFENSTKFFSEMSSKEGLNMASKQKELSQLRLKNRDLSDDLSNTMKHLESISEQIQTLSDNVSESKLKKVNTQFDINKNLLDNLYKRIEHSQSVLKNHFNGQNHQLAQKKLQEQLIKENALLDSHIDKHINLGHDTNKNQKLKQMNIEYQNMQKEMHIKQKEMQTELLSIQKEMQVKQMEMLNLQKEMQVKRNQIQMEYKKIQEYQMQLQLEIQEKQRKSNQLQQEKENTKTDSKKSINYIHFFVKMLGHHSSVRGMVFL